MDRNLVRLKPDATRSGESDIAAVAEHVAAGRERILTEIRMVIITG